jgi:hypothetical protein
VLVHGDTVLHRHALALEAPVARVGGAGQRLADGFVARGIAMAHDLDDALGVPVAAAGHLHQIAVARAVGQLPLGDIAEPESRGHFSDRVGEAGHHGLHSRFGGRDRIGGSRVGGRDAAGQEIRMARAGQGG